MSRPERRLVDLSHVISDGMETYPGLPTPRVTTHVSRERSAELYGPGVTFHIGLVTMCTNTGTYLDVPFHRFDGGDDLAELALWRVAEVPGVRIDARGQRAIELRPDDVDGLANHAVIVWTDHSRRFGTDAYAKEHPYLTARSADLLVDAAVACVGIDSLNIDDNADPTRPVHSVLLGAGIPIVEHLTNLGELPQRGFTFSAVPPKIRDAGTFTVRAYGAVPAGETAA